MSFSPVFRPIIRPAFSPSFRRAGSSASTGVISAPQTQPSLVGTPAMAFAPDYRASVLNSGGTIAGYLERVAQVSDISGNGRHLTQSTDAKRPLYLRVDAGASYLYCRPATLASQAPSSAAYYALMDAPANMTVQAKIAPLTWAPPVDRAICARYSGATLNWIFALNTSGGLSLTRKPGSSAAYTMNSTAAISRSANDPVHVKVVFVADTGSGQYSCTFYTSDDGVTFFQLGAVVTGAATSNIASSTTDFAIGGVSAADFTNQWYGRLYNIFLKNDATTVLVWTAETPTHGAATSALLTGSGTVTYRQPQVVIKQSVLLWEAASEMNLASYAVPSAYAGGVCVIGTTWSAAAFNTVTKAAGGFPCVNGFAGAAIYATNEAKYFGNSIGNSANQRIILGQVGATIINRLNGVDQSGGNTAAALPGPFVIFGYGTTDGTIFGRFCLNSPAHGTPAAVDTWLGDRLTS